MICFICMCMSVYFVIFNILIKLFSENLDIFINLKCKIVFCHMINDVYALTYKDCLFRFTLLLVLYLWISFWNTLVSSIPKPYCVCVTKKKKSWQFQEKDFLMVVVVVVVLNWYLTAFLGTMSKEIIHTCTCFKKQALMVK